MTHYIGEAVAADTAELTLTVETASRSVDRACDRQFGSVDQPQARYYTAHYDRHRRVWIIPTDDFATTDGLVVETVAGKLFTPVAGYLPAPVNAVVDGTVWTSLVIGSGAPVTPNGSENGLRITAKWGWPAVPAPVKLATLIQASRLYARKNAPFGIAGNLDVGEMRLLERLDVDLMTSVRPYARIWGAV
ncbi:MULTISPECIES: hypothetical protein [Mycobacterium]|nr:MULTISPECIES: hypothetical protein [Mycobacterium]